MPRHGRLDPASPPHPADLIAWLRWKTHRAALKHVPLWRHIPLPDGMSVYGRYLAEGKHNYVFRLRDSPRLLKIRRTQFYAPRTPCDSESVSAACDLQNRLAEISASPACSHLCGGAHLVDDAGRSITRARGVPPLAVERVFAALHAWSAASGVVILDYNEGNWCWDMHLLRLVDVDVNYTCALATLPDQLLVRRRVGATTRDPVATLSAFIQEEESLLIARLRRQGVLEA